MVPVSPPTFLEACGVAGPVPLSVLGTDGTSHRFLLDQPYALIGRHPKNTIPLDDSQVSQRHAYLQVLAGQLFCVDLGSRTGIHRGSGAFTSGWIQPGEVVRIGPFGICSGLPSPHPGLVAHGVPLDPLVERADEVQQMGDVSVEILQGRTRLSRWRMNRWLVLVGHDPLARLRLRDRSVSRFHCSLVATPQGIWVIDLLGRGSTTLNGLPVSSARIRDGDSLQVGCYTMQFRIQPALPPAKLPPPTEETPSPAPLRPATGMTPLPVEAPPGSDVAALIPLFQQMALQQQTMMDQFQQSMLMVVQMFMKMHQEQIGVLRDELAQLQELTAEIQATQQELLTRQAQAAATPTTFPRVEPIDDTAEGADRSPSAAEKQPAPDAGEMHAWLTGRIATLEQQRLSVWQRVMGVVLGR